MTTPKPDPDEIDRRLDAAYERIAAAPVQVQERDVQAWEVADVTIDTEEWRPVVGWEDVYDASSRGVLRRITPCRGVKPGHIIRGSRQVDGYVKVQLRQPGREKVNDWMHRVVVAAFYGPIPDGLEVDHRDGNPSNNHITNLEVVTHQENIQRAARMGRMPSGERNPNAVLTWALVGEIRRLSSEGMGGAEIARRIGFNKDTVYSVLQGKSWRGPEEAAA